MSADQLRLETFGSCNVPLVSTNFLDHGDIIVDILLQQPNNVHLRSLVVAQSVLLQVPVTEE